MSLVFSVAICTYNRADLLARALESVCAQSLSPVEYEVIVVDNNSSDHTRQVVETARARYPNVRYCLERQVGLAQARNRAWKEARGAYVAYIDDDCKVRQEWLAVAKEIVQAVQPDMFGGPYYPFYDTPKPAWFKDEYGSGVMAEKAGVLAREDQFLSGGNLFVCRELLQRLGGFPVEFGMAGETVAYGEETVLIRRVRRECPDALIYYDPRLSVYHLVRPNKMDLRWVLRQRFKHGRDAHLIFGDEHRLALRHVFGALALIFVVLYGCSLGLLFRDREKYPYAQNYLYERVFYWISLWGKFYERLRQTLRRMFRR